jgi:hypothetical protein
MDVNGQDRRVWMGVPLGLRERTPQVRGRAAPTRLARSLAVAATLAGFVSVSGAFGTGAITPGLRLVVLESAALAVVLAELGFSLALDRAHWPRSRPALRFGAISLAVTSVGVLFCWGLAVVMEGAARAPEILRFIPPATISFLAVVAIGWLAKRPATASQRPSAAEPEFMARLPVRLRGATLLAVQGEDHYVRVHTADGQHMLLMRLGEALDQLAALDGAQTHRSWWVARPAVTNVKRAHGRAALTLANGVQAPVSRRFSRHLRARGWY